MMHITNYHEINSYCRNENLDTEYLMYEIRAAKKAVRKKGIVSIVISMLGIAA